MSSSHQQRTDDNSNSIKLCYATDRKDDGKTTDDNRDTNTSSTGRAISHNGSTISNTYKPATGHHRLADGNSTTNTKSKRAPLPVPTPKRDVADEVAEGSASKQQRTATRQTAPTRPEATAEPPATRTRITAVTVKTKKGQEIKALSNEAEQEATTEKILLEPWVKNTEGLNKEQTIFRNETRDKVNEDTTSVYRSFLQQPDKSSTKQSDQVKVGPTTKGPQCQSKDSGKRIHRRSQRQWRHICVNINLLCPTLAINNGTHLQLDRQNRRHLNSIPTCQSCNRRFVHVSTNRVLQARGQHSVEAQQSHLRVEKQPKSLAKLPGRNISTTWDATAHKRAQCLQYSNRQRLHPRLCGWSPILGIANSCQQAFRRHTATFTATNRWPHSRKQCQLSWKKHFQHGRLLRDQPGNHIHNRTIEGSGHAQL